jgi:N-acetyl-anhydromuramyl-L-alanine amidase AmpD
MAMYPGRDGELMLTQPGTIVPDRNIDVVRIIMHQTWAPQSITNQAEINYNFWSTRTRDARKADPSSQFGVSAHFTIEADGRVLQHVDTKDGAKGTRDYSFDSIHIEFASKDEPLTNDQLFYGAELMAWIQTQHPNVPLLAVGTSNKDPGDARQRGITGHSFVEIVGKVKDPKLNCPGREIVAQMNAMAILASVRRANI